MIKFIHTADIHFGMENYGRIDQTTGIHSRLLDFEKALNNCIDYAIANTVDFFLFSGDAYKTAHPSPTQQRLLFRCFMRLIKANIPIVMVIGNHDNPLSFGKTHALDIFSQLPIDGFHVMHQPTTLTLTTKNGPINIVGIPWPSRATISLCTQQISNPSSDITQYIAQAVAAIIEDHAQKLDPSIPAVLAGHLTVSSGIFSGSEKRAIYGTDPILMPSQLAIPPFDYVGLGHLHRYQNLNPNGYPAVVYSGSIERVDFGERKEEKGFCLVTIAQKGNATHEFIQVPTRPFIQIEVTIKPESSICATDQVLRALQQQSIKNAVIKIIYHVPPGKKDTVDSATIQQACKDALYCVGIIPVRAPENRERRIQLQVDMDLKTLLTSYFESKPDLKEHTQSLVNRALQLQDTQNSLP